MWKINTLRNVDYMLKWYCLGYTGLIKYIIKINFICVALLLEMSLVENMQLHRDSHSLLLDTAAVEGLGCDKQAGVEMTWGRDFRYFVNSHAELFSLRN